MKKCLYPLAALFSISVALAQAPATKLPSYSQAYYEATSQHIFNSLQSAIDRFDESDKADLGLINSHSDLQVEKMQEKDPESSVQQEQSAAETRLTADFAQNFQQPDNIEAKSYEPGIPFEEPRDVYTFCPPGSSAERPISQIGALPFSDEGLSKEIEYVWGWSHCQADAGWSSPSKPSAIRIQKMWISSLKPVHPILTLEIVEDDMPGVSSNLEIDLNDLAAKKISQSYVFKFLWPSKND